MSREEHMHTTRYHVDHLHFEHSTMGLGRQLAQCPGVIRVDADRSTGIVAIDFDDHTVSAARLERMICDCGYECRCADTPVGHDARGTQES